MKKRISLIVALLVVMLAPSCKQEEIATFDQNVVMLNFCKKGLTAAFKEDSLQFEALFSGSATQLEYKLPIRLSGKIANENRTFNVRVNPTESHGIVEGTHFTLEPNQTFRAGLYQDSLILVLKVAEIKRDRVKGRLYIELVPNKTFSSGLDDYQYLIINISGAGLSSTPKFWNSNNLANYGGAYSAIKAEKFIELNNIPKIDWKAPNKAILYEYAKRTYEWFRDNVVMDGGERVVFKGTIEFY